MLEEGVGREHAVVRLDDGRGDLGRWGNDEVQLALAAVVDREALEDALAALQEGGEDAKPIAGGQSLVPLMNFRLTQPAALVDINAPAGSAVNALPPAPYGREDRPKPDALLTPPVQAKPQRNIELRSRSEEREDDPFDLPPEG